MRRKRGDGSAANCYSGWNDDTHGGGEVGIADAAEYSVDANGAIDLSNVESGAAAPQGREPLSLGRHTARLSRALPEENG